VTALATPRSSAGRASRYATLDLWRGVACLLVLVFHSVPYQSTSTSFGMNEVVAAVSRRLWLGVPMFFVISGYCITATIDSQRRKGRDVSTYFLKRVRRIFPPYWIVVLASAAVIGVMDVLLQGAITSGGTMLRPWWFSGWQWGGSLTLTETWRSHLLGGPKGLFLGPAWTLCYEEQFYLVSGLLLLVSPQRFFWGAAAVTSAVALTAVSGLSHSFIEGFFFDGSWFQFALGILLYYAVVYGARFAKGVAALTFALFALWGVAQGAALLSVEKNDAQVAVVAGVFALAALALHRFDRQTTEATVLRPLRACGAMCYSLYLVHLPIVAIVFGVLRFASFDVKALSPLLTIPLCVVPSVVVAWQFHKYVERRFMSAPAPVRVSRLAVAATA